jgi:hypothetical protein
MSDKSPAAATVCPRCRSEQTEVVTMSPVKNVWAVYGCKRCFYMWRSTEPQENTDPDHYPEAFRLTPEGIANMPVVPSIPPLRRKKD